MRSLSSSDFLELWEQGSRLHPLDQGLLILGAGIPEASYDSLADWPLGRRNQALAELRNTCFGPRLPAWIACGRCGEKLEFEMDGRMLARASAENEGRESEPIVVDGLSFRLPTSRDLARAAREADPRRAAIRLVEMCRLGDGESPPWSDELLDEVGQKMALADPMAEILMDLRCPVCGDEFSETLDIVSFLWTEIEARAKRLLMDIHALASAYGWTEKDVLSLSEHRRALYLEMVRA
jgi:hypothetical protein